MPDNPYVAFVLLPLAAYVVGATPFGFLIAKAKGVDLRKAGSGNVGATNVGRTLGRRWGLLAFALDLLKGLVPVLAAGAVLEAWGQGPGEVPAPAVQAAWLATGAAAVVGHVLTFWLKFRGGKGVATSLGVVLGVWPYFTLPALAAFALWIAVTLVSRYVSLGSIIAALAFVPMVVAFNRQQVTQLWPMLIFAGVIVVLILIRHRTNVKRLLHGNENRIGRKKE